MKLGGWLAVGSVVALGALALFVERQALAEDAAPACGARRLPPCPLQSIMRGINKKDAASVKAAIGGLGVAPAGYSNWTKHVDATLTAAKDGDMAAVEAACKGCHTEYRTRFQHEPVRATYKK